jgi:hypothetical protein
MIHLAINRFALLLSLPEVKDVNAVSLAEREKPAKMGGVNV